MRALDDPKLENALERECLKLMIVWRDSPSQRYPPKRTPPAKSPLQRRKIHGIRAIGEAEEDHLPKIGPDLVMMVERMTMIKVC